MGYNSHETRLAETKTPYPGTSSAHPGPAPFGRGAGRLLPGAFVCVAGGLGAWAIAAVSPGTSPLLIAIVLGALWRNLLPVPGRLSPGVTASSRSLLRAGIVLLGLQLSLSSILQLGPGALLVVVLSVGITFATTLWLGKALNVGSAQTLLIASGFSICGAAAVAGTANATKPKEEEVATAVALVVLFGTLMIPFLPFVGGLLGLPQKALGMWIGASTHEVAQVVAAAGTVGGPALAVAVTVKLARVLTLAPIVAGISLHRRRTEPKGAGKMPPIVPLFIIGFAAAVLLRTSGILPAGVLGAAQTLQTMLLSAAMFALGLGVHIKTILRSGKRPLMLGLLSTAIIATVSLAGTALFAASA
ncbi:putative sulfate exporter family transporter [Arthrobacter sp. GN70]|uniref:Putative sulfate exporter family transporter n=2 Tax=Arthrobacter TaxID=1663 RepID=A0A4R5KCT0_9MICC|nr:putative sulfate exporter family transporter [Arthrobacter sp. GN70]TDF92298.1 putative sulfate exporter family transporter [Arthrobacter terricola]